MAHSGLLRSFDGIPHGGIFWKDPKPEILPGGAWGLWDTYYVLLLDGTCSGTEFRLGVTAPMDDQAGNGLCFGLNVA